MKALVLFLACSLFFATTASASWRVQLGLYTKMRNVYNGFNSLPEQSLPLRVLRTSFRGSPAYVVQTTSIESKAEAIQLRFKLIDLGFKDCFVTETEN